MKIVKPRWLLSLPAVALVACVPAQFSPTVSVMPAPGKSIEIFAADQAACKLFAEQQITVARDQINSQIAGSVLLNAGLGAASAAGGDSGTIIANAASGGLSAANANLPNAQAATVGLQQQYDSAYSQCMFAKGNQVPGYAAAAPIAPTRHRHRMIRRVRRANPNSQEGSANPQNVVEPPSIAQPVSSPQVPVVEPPPVKQ